MNLPNTKTNVILIGMPGAGKSTVGVQLAKQLGLDFVDTDLLIQSQQAITLQEILDHQGYMALRAIEESVLLDLTVEKTLIATGGSAVYSDKAMRHLASLGRIVYLEVSLDMLQQRVSNEGSRGIARPEGQSFIDVFAERTPLYQQYADITYANNDHQNIELLADKIQHHS
jgi:shikimate kinase